MTGKAGGATTTDAHWPFCDSQPTDHCQPIAMSDTSNKYYNLLSAYSNKPWIWLVFSLYYFIPLLYISFSPIGYTLILGAYCFFIGLFLWACILPRQCVWLPIVIISLLALLLGLYTPSNSTMFAYAAFLVGYNYNSKIYLAVLSLFCGLLFILHQQVIYPAPFFAFTSIYGVICVSLWGYIERQRNESKIRWVQSRQEIEQLAAIAERERIARDLHDILGHSLSSIALKAELTEKFINQDKRELAQQQIADLNQIARQSLSLVRQTVSGYKHRGLSGEVMELCAKLRQQGFVVDLLGEIPRLSARAETALILALTELTTNILRHSKGNHCQLEFSRSPEQLLVRMRDNGYVEKLEPGNGLTGIKERLQALAGDLQADVFHGCEFVISLPLRELQHGD